MRRSFYILAIFVLLAGCSERLPDNGPACQQVEPDQEDSGQEAQMSLLEAADGGYLNKVREFLADGANLNARTQKGETLLHLAARRCNDEMVSFLTAKGLDANVRDNEGNTPLHLVQGPVFRLPISSIKKAISALLTNGADINARNNLGRTPLHYVASCSLSIAEVIEFLVSQGAEVNATDDYNLTPLDGAIDHEGYDAAKALRQHGGTVGNRYRIELFKAVKQNDLQPVRELIARGANVDSRGYTGITALCIAAERGNQELMQLLIANGADVDTSSTKDGWTVLHYAVGNGRLNAVKLLIENGVNINATDKQESTPLHLACNFSYTNIVKVLIAKSTFVNPKDCRDKTPLDYATKKELRQFLREHGAVSGKEFQEEGR